ncbi:MAG: SBBP repeat-containing protein, partial [Bacteroidia bacterium]|nr:SBBP repeat-containing protein [Bacteroidia bacterium]
EYKLVNSEERIANREKTSTPNPYSLLAIGSIVSFELTTYNHEHPLIIDPYWATYYGGVKYDFGLSIATDALGNVFMKGETNSPLGIPSSAGFQTVFIPDSLDDFLVKFDANGVRSWATYYGGKSNLNGSDNGRSIATDASGNIFMTGQTRFLTNIGFGGFQNTFAGGISDAYLVKFNSAGLPIWSTYYGGIGDDWGSSVATDASGNVYLAGYTTSQSNIASAGFQNVFGGDILDAFLVKFDGSGSRIWATYYGGTRNDWGYSVDTDAAGNVYMSGSTRSTASIASGGFQNIYGGGSNDAFLVKFNTAGARIWGTYYGGNNFDYGYSVTVDAANNVYMAGYTGSGINIGSANGHQNAFGGFYDAFLVKVSGTGGPASRLWGTYYGSTAWEWAWDIVTDTQNNVYLFMEAEDVETPNLIDACSYQPIFNGGDSLRGFKEDQIIVKFNSNGIKLCATYMGGTGEDDLDFGGGITIYGDILYLTGGTNGGYPVTANAFQTIYAGPNGFTSSGYTNTGGSDAFIASLCTNICEGKSIGLDYTSNSQNTCSGSPVKFIPSIANSCDTTGYKYHWVFTGGTPAVSDSVSPTVKFSGAGSYDVKLLVTTLCKKDSITKTNYITITPCGGCTLNAQYTKGTANCTNCGCKEWIMVTGINGTPPYNYQWPDGYDRRYKNSLCPGVYNVIVTDNNGCKSTVKVNAP